MKKVSKKQREIRKKEMAFYTHVIWAVLISGFCVIAGVVVLAKSIVNSW